MLPLQAAISDDSLAIVFIDDDTEGVLGDMPIDRAYYAKAIERLADAGARAVVLKFFFEQSMQSDDQLAAAMQQLPVLLQSRSGHQPIGALAKHSHAIGSVDFDGFPVRLTGSLALAVTEQVKAGSVRRLKQNERVELELELPGDYKSIPLHELLDSNDWQQSVKNKVVIIAYDGSKMDEMQTPYGSATPHRVFIALVKALLKH